MNILLINHYAGSVYHGMEYRPYYFAREWINKGHDVTIIAGTYSHLRKQNPQNKRDFEEEIIDGVRYVWVNTGHYQGNGIRRACTMLQFPRKLYLHAGMLVKKYRPDAVIASSTYPLDAYPAHRIAKKAGARLIHEVHDLWPLTLMELGHLSKGNPMIRVLQRAENHAYQRADKVVSLLPNAYEYMKDHYVTPDKYVHIPNGIVLSDWTDRREPAREDIRLKSEQLRAQGYFIVGYIGGFALSNSLMQLVEVAKRTQDEKIAYMLVGDGVLRPCIEQVICENNLTNVYLFDRIDKLTVPETLPLFDIVYAGGNKCGLYRYGIAMNKLFEYMMAERPVVIAFDTEKDVVSQSGCGIKVPAEDVEAIRGAILKLRDMTPDERLRLGQKGRAYILENHEYQKLAERFIEVMRSEV